MALDPDIAAAATPLELEKLRLQEYRNDILLRKADRAQQLLTAQNMQVWAAANVQSPPEEIAAEARRRLVLTLAEKYMTTSTATDPLLVKADAEKDATRLKAAVDEVLLLLP